jgi:hypothetical protein
MQMRCSPVLIVGAHGVVLGPQDGPIHHSIMDGHTWGKIVRPPRGYGCSGSAAVGGSGVHYFTMYVGNLDDTGTA